MLSEQASKIVVCLLNIWAVNYIIKFVDNSQIKYTISINIIYSQIVEYQNVYSNMLLTLFVVLQPIYSKTLKYFESWNDFCGTFLAPVVLLNSEKLYTSTKLKFPKCAELFNCRICETFAYV